MMKNAEITEMKPKYVNKSLVLLLLLALCLCLGQTQRVEGATLGKVKTLKVMVNDNQVEVIWSKVTNATKYQVYRAGSKNGTYRLVKTTTARKWIDKGRKGIVWYKVRAVKGSTKGSFSAKKHVYRAGGVLKSYTKGAGSRIFKVCIRNYSENNKMYFLPGSQGWSQVSVLNLQTGKIVRQYAAALCDSKGATNLKTSIVSKGDSSYIYVKAIGADFSYYENSVYEYVVAVTWLPSANADVAYTMAVDQTESHTAITSGKD